MDRIDAEPVALNFFLDFLFFFRFIGFQESRVKNMKIGRVWRRLHLRKTFREYIQYMVTERAF